MATDGTGIFAVFTLNGWNEKRIGYFLYRSYASTLKMNALTIPSMKTVIHRILFTRFTNKSLIHVINSVQLKNT